MERSQSPWRFVALALAGLWLMLRSLPAAQSPTPAPQASAPPPLATATPAPRVSSSGNDGALKALETGNLRGARQLAERAVKERPDDPEAHRLLADVEFQAGNYDLSLAEARKALKLADALGPERRKSVLFTLARVAPFADPQEALEIVREMNGEARFVGASVMMADTLLHAAAARGASGEDRRKAVEEARSLLAPHEREAATSGMEADYLAVVGNLHLMAGELPQARKSMEAALAGQLGLSDRVTDLASALAWISFQQGDRKGMARNLDRALQALAADEVGNAFSYLPKWENYRLMRLALTGEEPTGVDPRQMEGVRRRLDRAGYEDLLDYRQDRQKAHALGDAWERKDYDQAFYLLARSVLPPREKEPPPGMGDMAPKVAIAEGPQRVAPRCFYREMVDNPLHELMGPLFLGRMAERADRPDLARFWYERCLQKYPGNAVVEELLAGLPDTSGKVPDDLGAPGPEDTIRILDRLAKNGWTSPLLEGMPVLSRRGGVGRHEFDRWQQERTRDYAEVVALLGGAQEALAEGSRFAVQSVPDAGRVGRTPDDPEAWGWKRAVLSAPRLSMHSEDRLWFVTVVEEPGLTFPGAQGSETVTSR